jgi:hypothetical protein
MRGSNNRIIGVIWWRETLKLEPQRRCSFPKVSPKWPIMPCGQTRGRNKYHSTASQRRAQAQSLSRCVAAGANCQSSSLIQDASGLGRGSARRVTPEHPCVDISAVTESSMSTKACSPIGLFYSECGGQAVYGRSCQSHRVDAYPPPYSDIVSLANIFTGIFFPF